MKYCLLSLSILLAGCTTAQFAPSSAGAKTMTGQMRYAGAKRTFVGDFTARVSATEFQLDVSKGPGVALLSVHESNGTLARFEGGNRAWQGNPQHFIPGQLRSWLALHDVFLDRPRPDVRASRTDSLINAEFLPTHERFTFQINR
ncbi:MAG: hypothetical protein QOD99_1164 [Chthoniobacter sp.]|jgi:hypothetical protein|nr:hypothetical protein [Chthoniobacter sp.]